MEKIVFFSRNTIIIYYYQKGIFSRIDHSQKWNPDSHWIASRISQDAK